MKSRRIKWVKDDGGEMIDAFVVNRMNLGLPFLQSTELANQFKPAILQCFGDIAGAIGGHFETYLSVGEWDDQLLSFFIY